MNAMHGQCDNCEIIFAILRPSSSCATSKRSFKMRVAISGTHCSGKSSLINEFLLAHPDFAHEPEAYEALQEDYGQTFAADPSAEDFHRQLEYNVGRLRQY